MSHVRQGQEITETEARSVTEEKITDLDVMIAEPTRMGDRVIHSKFTTAAERAGDLAEMLITAGEDHPDPQMIAFSPYNEHGNAWAEVFFYGNVPGAYEAAQEFAGTLAEHGGEAIGAPDSILIAWAMPGAAPAQNDGLNELLAMLREAIKDQNGGEN